MAELNNHAPNSQYIMNTVSLNSANSDDQLAHIQMAQNQQITHNPQLTQINSNSTCIRSHEDQTPVIVVLGADQSGKSSLIDAITRNRSIYRDLDDSEYRPNKIQEHSCSSLNFFRKTGKPGENGCYRLNTNRNVSGGSRKSESEQSESTSDDISASHHQENGPHLTEFNQNLEDFKIYEVPEDRTDSKDGWFKWYGGNPPYELDYDKLEKGFLARLFDENCPEYLFKYPERKIIFCVVFDHSGMTPSTTDLQTKNFRTLAITEYVYFNILKFYLERVVLENNKNDSEEGKHNKSGKKVKKPVMPNIKIQLLWNQIDKWNNNGAAPDQQQLDDFGKQVAQNVREYSIAKAERKFIEVMATKVLEYQNSFKNQNKQLINRLNSSQNRENQNRENQNLAGSLFENVQNTVNLQDPQENQNNRMQSEQEILSIMETLDTDLRIDMNSILSHVMDYIQEPEPLKTLLTSVFWKNTIDRLNLQFGQLISSSFFSPETYKNLDSMITETNQRSGTRNIILLDLKTRLPLIYCKEEYAREHFQIAYKQYCNIADSIEELVMHFSNTRSIANSDAKNIHVDDMQMDLGADCFDNSEFKFEFQKTILHVFVVDNYLSLVCWYNFQDMTQNRGSDPRLSGNLEHNLLQLKESVYKEIFQKK